MVRNILFTVLLTLAAALPVTAAQRPQVGAVFAIESPEVFSDQVLGTSKGELEQQLSALLAERLEFYFPFFDWTTDALPDANALQITMVDRASELCDWQSVVEVRAVRAGSAEEMVGVPDAALYDLCDPFLPNRKDPEGDGLLPEDAEALKDRLAQFIEDTSDDSTGLLDNASIRDAIHHDLLATLPLAREFEFEVREQANGAKFLYLPLDFNELKASTDDEACEGADRQCALLKLELEIPDSPLPASLSLRIAGKCGDQVLCEVMGGSVPGGARFERTWWEDGIGDLLARASSLSVTMKEFTKAPHVCATLADTSLFDEP